MATPTLRISVRDNAKIARAIEGVKRGVVNRVVRQAVAKAARAGSKVAKQRAPKGQYGLLRRAVGMVVKARRSKGTWEAKIGARRGFKRQIDGRWRDPARYAHLAEYGRVSVKPTRKLALTLHSLARYARRVASAGRHPFMLPTWKQVSGAGLKQITADIRAGIKAEARKYRRKGKSIYLK